jgi:hypothetical protein
MPFTDFTTLGSTSTFNDLFISQNNIITRTNLLEIGTISGGTGITATSPNTMGGVTLSVSLLQGPGISLTQGSGITVELNTSFIKGSTGVAVTSTTSGITLSVKLNAGNSIVLTEGPAGITIASSITGEVSQATFADTRIGTGPLSSSGLTFNGKTALQILEMILFPFQSPSITITSSGITSQLEMGHTLGTELRGTTFSIANSGNVTANSLGISFQGPNTSVWANVSSAGPTVSPRGWSFSSPQTGASLINANTAKLRVSATTTQNPPTGISSDSTISWNHKVYAGFTSGSSADLILNQSGITGPTGPFVTTALTSSPGQSITVNLTKNNDTQQFMWILIPSGYTLVSNPLFTVSNNESPFNLESTGTFTNSVNFPSLYKKYKSEQPQSAASVNVLFNLAKV